MCFKIEKASQDFCLFEREERTNIIISENYAEVYCHDEFGNNINLDEVPVLDINNIVNLPKETPDAIIQEASAY